MQGHINTSSTAPDVHDSKITCALFVYICVANVDEGKQYGSGLAFLKIETYYETGSMDRQYEICLTNKP